VTSTVFARGNGQEKGKRGEDVRQHQT